MMRRKEIYSGTEIAIASSQLYKEETYWLAKLSGELKKNVFPCDNETAHPGKHGLHRITFALTGPSFSKLMKITKGSDYKIHMILMAGIIILLNKHTGDHDILLGMPIYWQKIDASFINTVLAIRNQLIPGMTFKELLMQVKQSVTEAVEHVNYPIETLLYLLGLDYHGNDFPLFDIFVLLENIHNKNDIRHIHTNITFSFLRREEDILGNLEYNSSLYGKETIERIVNRLILLLETVLPNVDIEISGMEIMTCQEKKHLLEDFNITELSFPGDKTIPGLFQQQVAGVPHHIAVVFKQNHLTYSELNKRVNQLAGFLKARNIGPDTIVGLMLGKSVNMLIGILGILKAGGAYMPLDPNYPPDRLHYMIKDAGVRWIVTGVQWEDILCQYPTSLICLDKIEDDILREPWENPPPGASPRNLAYIIYTSGSTGLPKGTLIEHRSAANLKNWQAHTFQINEQSRILQFFSYNFDGAVGETLMALLNGAALVMLDLDQLEPGRLMEFINAHRINLAVMVPSMLKQLNPSQLRHPGPLTIVSVGEACAPDLVSRWSPHCRFVNGYGPTETTVYSHTWETNREAISKYHSVPVGKPIANYKSYILDKNLKPIPVGVVGEIYISGVGLARGYLNNPEITAQRFIPNPFFPGEKYEDRGFISLESTEEERKAFQEREKSYFSLRQRIDLDIRKHGIISPESIMELVRDLDQDLIEATGSFIDRYHHDPFVIDGFCRYLYEGLENSYSSCGLNEKLLSFLLSYENLQGLKGVDFGFGNGEIMDMLRKAGCCIKGFDLSPFFVQHARDKGADVQMLKIDTPTEIFRKQCRVEEETQDFAISTLVLDRVENPRLMLENLFRLLKPAGRFAIQTLMPIIPVDDGNVDEPIVYTPEQNRIAPGKDIQQDKLQLVALLDRLGAGKIQIYRFPFVVLSNDGFQEYTAWSFTGIKRTDRNKENECDKISYEMMYKTGDLGYYSPDGNIGFSGRSDQQVKIRGFRVELGEIESQLLKWPNIKEAVVIAKEAGNGEKHLWAYLVAENRTGETQELHIQQLREYMEKALPKYMVPTYFSCLEKIPLTQNGKIDRKALVDLETMEESNEVIAPRNEMEKKLVEIWADVLEVEKRIIGINSNFFQLGGHSLKATQVVSRVHKNLNTRVSLVEVFQNPTIRDLAKYLKGKIKDPYASIEPAEKKEYYPLSTSQRRLYIVNRLSVESISYNVPYAVLLEGKINREKMEVVFMNLIKRHESLHTCFEMIDHEPAQRILVDAPFALEYYQSGEDKAKEILQRFIRPFDLSQAPLLRVGLIRIDEERHIFMVDMHHIISDAESVVLLIKEFAALMQGEKLPRLRLQYTDFSVWYRQMIKSGEIKKQEEYWLKTFAGDIPTLNLPTDYSRPEVQHFEGNHLYRELAGECGIKLNESLKETQTTLYMFLLAVLNVLLSKYTGQEDIIVGSPVSERRHTDLEHIFGMFVGQIAIRNRPLSSLTFREFLDQVKENTLKASENQNYQFDELVSILGLQGNSARNPLFDVVFAVQNQEIAKKEKAYINTIGDLKFYPYPYELNTSKTDLRLGVEETNDTIILVLTYAAALFKKERMEKMLDRFIDVLDEVLNDLDIGLEDIRLSHSLASVQSTVYQEVEGEFGF